MNQIKKIRTIGAALGIVILSSLWQGLSAYTPGACRQDGEKLCPGVTTDKELIPCLKQYETELSTACKVNLAEARQMVRDTKDACQPDIKKYCADVPSGHGQVNEVRRCLKAHEAELSSACKNQVETFRNKYQITGSPQ